MSGETTRNVTLLWLVQRFPCSRSHTLCRVQSSGYLGTHGAYSNWGGELAFAGICIQLSSCKVYPSVYNKISSPPAGVNQ